VLFGTKARNHQRVILVLVQLLLQHLFGQKIPQISKKKPLVYCAPWRSNLQYHRRRVAGRRAVSQGGGGSAHHLASHFVSLHYIIAELSIKGDTQALLQKV
jgi:hypothetical protein